MIDAVFELDIAKLDITLKVKSFLFPSVFMSWRCSLAINMRHLLILVGSLLLCI